MAFALAYSFVKDIRTGICIFFVRSYTNIPKNIDVL